MYYISNLSRPLPSTIGTQCFHILKSNFLKWVSKFPGLNFVRFHFRLSQLQCIRYTILLLTKLFQSWNFASILHTEASCPLGPGNSPPPKLSSFIWFYLKCVWKTFTCQVINMRKLFSKNIAGVMFLTLKGNSVRNNFFVGLREKEIFADKYGNCSVSNQFWLLFVNRSV